MGVGRIVAPMIKEEVRRRGDDHDDEHDETLREDYERNLRGDEFSGHSWELLDQPLKTIGMDQLEVHAAATKAWKSLPEKRDWMAEFFTGFSCPGYKDGLLRLQMNARRFQHNYLYVFGAGLATAILTNPYFLLSVAIIGGMLRYASETPIKIKDHILSNQEKAALIGSVAVLLNYMCGTFHTLLMGTFIGLGLVLVHIFLHNPFIRTSSEASDGNEDNGGGDHEV